MESNKFLNQVNINSACVEKGGQKLFCLCVFDVKFSTLGQSKWILVTTPTL